MSLVPTVRCEKCARVRDRPGADWSDHPAKIPGEVLGVCKTCADLWRLLLKRKWDDEGRKLLKDRERGYGHLTPVGDVFANFREGPEAIEPRGHEEEAMPLVIKESGAQHFEPAPPGLHEAVCVDVVDMGIVPTKFGPKSKVKVIWQIKMLNKEGERFQARATYTQSLMEGSNLRRDLESWRGRTFTPDELKGFDVEKLLGVNCQLSLKHAISKSTGRTYAQVTVVLPANKGQAMKPEKYTREPWPASAPDVPPGLQDPNGPDSDEQYGEEPPF